MPITVPSSGWLSTWHATDRGLEGDRSPGSLRSPGSRYRDRSPGSHRSPGSQRSTAAEHRSPGGPQLRSPGSPPLLTASSLRFLDDMAPAAPSPQRSPVTLGSPSLPSRDDAPPQQPPGGAFRDTAPDAAVDATNLAAELAADLASQLDAERLAREEGDKAQSLATKDVEEQVGQAQQEIEGLRVIVGELRAAILGCMESLEESVEESVRRNDTSEDTVIPCAPVSEEALASAVRELVEDRVKVVEEHMSQCLGELRLILSHERWGQPGEICRAVPPPIPEEEEEEEEPEALVLSRGNGGENGGGQEAEVKTLSRTSSRGELRQGIDECYTQIQNLQERMEHMSPPLQQLREQVHLDKDQVRHVKEHLVKHDRELLQLQEHLRPNKAVYKDADTSACTLACSGQLQRLEEQCVQDRRDVALALDLVREQLLHDQAQTRTVVGHSLELEKRLEDVDAMVTRQLAFFGDRLVEVHSNIAAERNVWEECCNSLQSAIFELDTRSRCGESHT